MISRFTDPLISILYPRSCGSCGAQVERTSDGAACRACWEATTIFRGRETLCAKCGLPVNSVTKESPRTCRECEEHHYDRAVSAGVYEKALLASVLQLKRDPHVSSTAAAHFRCAFDRIGLPGGVLLVPVPLSPQRRLERGFNQARVLASVISKHARLAVDSHSLARIHDTPMHRAAMDAKARDKTVAGVFAVERPRLIVGRDILLIDDLMTSGATVSHCARVLKKNGAGKVIVLTLARAVLK